MNSNLKNALRHLDIQLLIKMHNRTKTRFGKHFGSEQKKEHSKNSQPIIHSGVSDQASKWVVREIMHTNEQVAQKLRLDCWLFWTTVERRKEKLNDIKGNLWPFHGAFHKFNVMSEGDGISPPSPTVVQNRKKRKNNYLIIHFPTSSGVSELARQWSKQCRASEWVIVTSEQDNRMSMWPSTYVLIRGCFEPQCSIIASPFVHQAEKKSNTVIRLWSKQKDNGLSLSFFSPPLDGLVVGWISPSSANLFCPLFYFRMIESCRASEVGKKRRDTIHLGWCELDVSLIQPYNIQLLHNIILKTEPTNNQTNVQADERDMCS